MADLAHIVASFRHWSHCEFMLLGALPALAAPKLGLPPRGMTLHRRLTRLDRRLFDAAPALGCYAWETVVILEK